MSASSALRYSAHVSRVIVPAVSVHAVYTLHTHHTYETFADTIWTIIHEAAAAAAAAAAVRARIPFGCRRHYYNAYTRVSSKFSLNLHRLCMSADDVGRSSLQRSTEGDEDAQWTRTFDR